MKAVLCPAVLLLVAAGGGGGGAEAGLLGAGTGEGSCAAPPFRKIPVYCNSVNTSYISFSSYLAKIERQGIYRLEFVLSEIRSDVAPPFRNVPV